jgi:hypothetical protein
LSAAQSIFMRVAFLHCSLPSPARRSGIEAGILVPKGGACQSSPRGWRRRAAIRQLFSVRGRMRD